jgi:hypothetical protein
MKKTFTANIGLWGTAQQGKISWILDATGKPVCKCDDSADRSVSRLTAMGYSILPRDGQTIESLIARGYLTA